MAQIAALALVDIEPGLLERSARLDLHGALLGGGAHRERDHLDETADADHQHDQHDQQPELALDYVVVHDCAPLTAAPAGSGAGAVISGAAGSGAGAGTGTGRGFSCRTVIHTFQAMSSIPARNNSPPARRTR